VSGCHGGWGIYQCCARFQTIGHEADGGRSQCSVMQLQLGKVWVLGERIDGGGFGQVYAAKSADYDAATVVKLVPKAPGAERELLFTDLVGVRNVVPIIDQGETENSWALVMPGPTDRCASTWPRSLARWP
jgi:hypothetical protein